MDAYVINLARRRDRREKFIKDNAEPIRNFVFFDAVDGRAISRQQLTESGLLSEGSEKFGPGAIGSALSHLHLWNRCIESGTPLLIFEDDAVVRRDFWTRAHATMDRLESDWDILFLGYNTDVPITVGFGSGMRARIQFESQSKNLLHYLQTFAAQSGDGEGNAVLQALQLWGLMAYAISPKGAALMRKICFPLSTKDLQPFNGLHKAIGTFTIEAPMNLHMAQRRLRSWCSFPPIAASANDRAGSDIRLK